MGPCGSAADGRGVVELECERPVDPAGRETFEPLGFAVEKIPAWRQWGRASIVVEGDWQVEWADAGRNRRIDPPLSARRPGFVAAYAYDSQPARLPLRVLPRGSRVVIEPEYRYDVSAARVALDARLRAHDVDLICLAGFMRLLTAPFVEAWRDRMLNIHPSLLPAFPGLDTHARALAAALACAGACVPACPHACVPTC